MEILRYAAFTDRPDGGNPAGIVLAADGISTRPRCSGSPRTSASPRPHF